MVFAVKGALGQVAGRGIVLADGAHSLAGAQQDGLGSGLHVWTSWRAGVCITSSPKRTCLHCTKKSIQPVPDMGAPACYPNESRFRSLNSISLCRNYILQFQGWCIPHLNGEGLWLFLVHPSTRWLGWRKGIVKASSIKPVWDTQVFLLPPLAHAMWVVTVSMLRGAHKLQLQGALKPEGKTGKSHSSLAQSLQKSCRVFYCHCYFLHRSMWKLWLFGYHTSCQCSQFAVKMLETCNGWEHLWDQMRDLSNVLSWGCSRAAAWKSQAPVKGTPWSSIVLMEPVISFCVWSPCFKALLDAPKPIGFSIP